MIKSIICQRREKCQLSKDVPEKQFQKISEPKYMLENPKNKQLQSHCLLRKKTRINANQRKQQNNI